jgi:hypothetical protein
MNGILILFIFFTITILIAWLGKYRLSIWLFLIFLMLSTAVFLHHITDAIPIQL